MKLKSPWMKKNSARKPKDDLQISKKQKIQQKRKAAKKLQRQQKIAKNSLNLPYKFAVFKVSKGTPL